MVVQCMRQSGEDGEDGEDRTCRYNQLIIEGDVISGISHRDIRIQRKILVVHNRRI